MPLSYIINNKHDISIIPDVVHPSWSKFLSKETVSLIGDIYKQIGNDYTPYSNKVLRFMSLDLYNAKVIILGQDPYKPEGIATGRAFQPSNLIAWSQKYRQVSLKNIIRLIYKTYLGIEEYKDIPSYTKVAFDIDNGIFPIKEPAEWFDSTEKQGVLWLNTSFTCKIGVSNSHKTIWEPFTHLLFKYIASENPNLIWFLWGKEAQKFENYAKLCKYTFKSNHPMMCSESYDDDFLKSNCFASTWSIINWLG